MIPSRIPAPAWCFKFTQRRSSSFRGDRFHFRKFHEQFFNLALLMRLRQAGPFHDGILSRRGAEEKDSELPPCKVIICGNNKHSANTCRVGLAYAIEFFACAVIVRFSGSTDCIAGGR
jgi:hypothetical protein